MEKNPSYYLEELQLETCGADQEDGRAAVCFCSWSTVTIVGLVGIMGASPRTPDCLSGNKSPVDRPLLLCDRITDVLGRYGQGCDIGDTELAV
ncbi:hypothetical protein VTN00DRAFT_7432 [Thermoascus crustaceus]|uniref:uncharacterized protein n=1 Tax=Thermoascus crustaceus TaxID=5088 RepID=UPI0037424357